jgi:hypothetical protein
MTAKKHNQFELEAVKNQRKQMYASRVQQAAVNTGIYTAPELRRQAARPGALDAYTLPSRFGNRRTFPGRGERK